MHRSTIAILLGTALTFAAPTVLAAQKGHGPKANTNAGPKPKSGGAKAHGGPKPAGTTHVAHGGSKSQNGPKVHAQGPKSKTPPRGGPNKTPTAITTTTSSNTGRKTKSAMTVATSSTSGTTALTPVQQKLQRNTKLAGKLQGRLPAGTDMMKAAEGFRNLGQFVAAVNVSNNLGLSFTQLKSRMVDDGMSLGQSIKDLRPSANTTTEVRRAETDANTLITTTEADASRKTKKSH